MDLKTILAGGGGIILVILTVIQVVPIKINPWSAIANFIGKAINKEIINKLDSIDKKVGSLECKVDYQYATQCRTRIVRFSDEIRHKERHSKEHFDQVLIDCGLYEQYCTAHPDYKNNVAVLSINLIKDTYQKCMKENDFL